MSELESLTSDQSLGLPDKTLSEMTTDELSGLGSIPDDALEQQMETKEPEPERAAEAPEETEEKTNLQVWKEMNVSGPDASEPDEEVARLRQETERLQRQLDKQRDDELENARSLLRGQQPEPEPREEINYTDPSLVAHYESLGLDRDQAEAVLTANGRMVEERARQIAGAEVQSLRDEWESTKQDSAAAEETTQRANTIAQGMARLARLGGTARDLVAEYAENGSGDLWDYLNSEPSRLTSSSTVYDAGLGLAIMVDTAASKPSAGATSLPAEGSNRSQRLEETKREKTWEDDVVDGLAASADPFKDSVPFLSKDYLQDQ